MPKAYYAHEKDGDCATIVFADTPSQAKRIAQTCDCCEDAEYIDLRVRRMPEADKLYKGAPEIDWYDDETRITLVRDFGWQCFEPSYECDTCLTKQYCSWFEEEQKCTT